jgi:hypothetical protein
MPDGRRVDDRSDEDHLDLARAQRVRLAGPGDGGSTVTSNARQRLPVNVRDGRERLEVEAQARESGVPTPVMPP